MRVQVLRRFICGSQWFPRPQQQVCWTKSETKTNHSKNVGITTTISARKKFRPKCECFHIPSPGLMITLIRVSILWDFIEPRVVTFPIQLVLVKVLLQRRAELRGLIAATLITAAAAITAITEKIGETAWHPPRPKPVTLLHHRGPRVFPRRQKQRDQHWYETAAFFTCPCSIFSRIQSHQKIVQNSVKVKWH